MHKLVLFFFVLLSGCISNSKNSSNNDYIKYITGMKKTVALDVFIKAAGIDIQSGTVVHSSGLTIYDINLPDSKILYITTSLWLDKNFKREIIERIDLIGLNKEVILSKFFFP